MTVSAAADYPPLTGQALGESRRAMGVMTALFFMCGFLATLNDVLIPHLKLIFDLNYAEIMLVQFSFFSAFLLFAFPAGALVQHFGYKNTLASGLLIMSAGAMLFIPAASLPSFPLFLTALLVLAGGITFLQVSGNPYVAILGSPQTASSRLNLIQAFNSLGSTIAPSIGGILILSAGPQTPDVLRLLSASALHAYRLHEAASVRMPYLGIASTLFVLAVVVILTRLPAAQPPKTAGTELNGRESIWTHRHLLFGVIAIFVYVGTEITIGSFLVSYITQPEIGNMARKTAATYVSVYWGGSMIGRFVGSAILRRIATGKLLGFNAVAALGLITLSIVSSGNLAMWSILLTGVFNSIMFPSIFTLGIAELGPLTGKASGILMAAAVGGAIIPVLQGAMADQIGVQRSFLVPAVCYVCVAFFGFVGSRPHPQSRADELILD